MKAIFIILTQALWVVSCAVTIAMSFWIIRRNFRQALYGEAHGPIPLWADRLEKGMGWLRWPIICFQLIVFVKYAYTVKLLTLIILGACILIVLAPKLWDEKKGGPVGAH